jgi:hypothetical protein
MLSPLSSGSQDVVNFKIGGKIHVKVVFFSKKKKSSKGLLSGTKVVFFWSDFYETWSSRKIGDTGYMIYGLFFYSMLLLLLLLLLRILLLLLLLFWLCSHASVLGGGGGRGGGVGGGSVINGAYPVSPIFLEDQFS